MVTDPIRLMMMEWFIDSNAWITLPLRALPLNATTYIYTGTMHAGILNIKIR